MSHSTLSFSWTAEYPSDTLYFAMCYPYTYTDLRAYLARIQADPLRARHVRRAAGRPRCARRRITCESGLATVPLGSIVSLLVVLATFSEVLRFLVHCNVAYNRWFGTDLK